MKVKLVYFDGCPLFKETKKILENLGTDFEIVKQDELPDHHPLRAYSSPSILKGDKLIFGSKLDENTSACSFSKIDMDSIKRQMSSL